MKSTEQQHHHLYSHEIQACNEVQKNNNLIKSNAKNSKLSLHLKIPSWWTTYPNSLISSPPSSSIMIQMLWMFSRVLRPVQCKAGWTLFIPMLERVKVSSHNSGDASTLVLHTLVSTTAWLLPFVFLCNIWSLSSPFSVRFWRRKRR
jgi:hypothetical protein